MEVNKSMELLKELLKDKSTIYDANYCLATSQAIKNVLSELERLQKENSELRKGQNSLMQSRKKWKDRYYREKNHNKNSIPKEKIENLINSLKNDIVNTKIKMEKEKYIDYIRKARLKAFNTKMNEIIDKLQELLEGGIK